MLYNLLAFLPFILIIYLLVIKSVKTLKVMSLVYISTFLILFFVWNSSFFVLLSSSLRGVIMSLELFLIIFSVLLMYNLLRLKGGLDMLKDFMQKISTDKNIQIILIGWFLVSFFEGIAGFGTPAAIAAPLLILLGIRAITAVIIALVADSVSVVFGAFGTPLIVGLMSSVTNADLAQISLYSGILNGVISIFMPLVLLLIYHILEKIPLRNLRKYLGIAFFAGLFFAIPYILVSYLIGPELPSVVASLLGFFLTLILVRKSSFMGESAGNISYRKLFNLIILPYFSLILLFIVSRLNLFSFGDMLRFISINFYFTEGISHTLSLYSPGFIIFFIFILFTLIFNITRKNFNSLFSESFEKTRNVFLTLIVTLAFVQLLTFSNINGSDLPGIPQTIALASSNIGVLYLFIAPLIGAFGSFITGSATVSNLIFSSIQYNAAISNSLPESLILALQTSGAAAGNMIALHNILAVLALVNLKNEESKIIKFNLVIVLLYSLIVSLIALGLYLFVY